MKNRIVDWNARHWFVPTLLVKAVLAFVISGIVMAILVPALAVRGWHLTPMIAWGVIVVTQVICLGPDVVAWRRRRKDTGGRVRPPV